MSETGRLSRRCLLARLAALPAAFALRVLTASESGEAKNKHGHGHGHGHGKHHKHKKRRNKQKSHRARGGYAPDSEEQAFLALINQYRAQNGVGALALQPQLGAAANHHSEAMAQNNFFAHSALESVKNFGYTNWRYIGENIYAGTASASSAMNAWKNSADHNTNM